MTEQQLQYANIWMGLFNHDYDDIAHQLYVKKMAGNYHIDGFSSDEADEIWSYIEGIVQENAT
jgi:hypothetical protein